MLATKSKANSKVNILFFMVNPNIISRLFQLSVINHYNWSSGESQEGLFLPL
ncbi:hypothetical protein MYAER_0814 [Microcystis aeruginosa NIES-2549]|uniref:Uncharacterized protein n=1 Tax=Microcystis aeruginosa NIES-2549 TaxID=1641812 RepID=A0A0F6U1Y8_MICAE|nr:hypothetical protein MYAER_0814 [Microcystis aeruginosa NIES-2549]